MTHTPLSDTQYHVHLAYARLWSKLPFYQIRVKSICEETPIARSTFYNYYDDIDMLRQEVEERLLTALIQLNQIHFEKMIQAPSDLTFIASTLGFIKQEESFFRAFLIDQYNPSFIYKWKQAMIAHLRLILKQDSHNFDLKLEVFTSAAITIFTEVLKNPTTHLSLDDLQQLIFKVLE